MKSTNTIDAARVGLLLSELRLPTLAARLSTPSTQCRAHGQQGAGDGAPWHTASIFGNAALRSLSERSRHGPKANPG